MTCNTVVCIEHKNSTAAVLESIIQDLGFKTKVFNCFGSAVEWLSDNPASVVMVNCRINGEDALSTIKCLRHICGDATRFVGITTSRIPQDHEVFLEAGVDTLLVRPYTHGDVTECIVGNPNATPDRSSFVKLESLDDALRPANSLDQEILDALVQEISVDCARDAIESFVSDLQLDLATVSVRNGDHARYAAFAHPIKSVAWTFGAWELARAAEDLETVSRLGGTSTEMRGLLSVVNDCASRFVSSVNALDWTQFDDTVRYTEAF